MLDSGLESRVMKVEVGEERSQGQALAINVKDANKSCGIRVLADGAVDLFHQPVEHPGVDHLGQGVLVVCGSVDIQWTHNGTCICSLVKSLL